MIEEGIRRVYAYKYPVITCRVPPEWIQEAVDDANENNDGWANWTVARNIGDKLFMSYYNLTKVRGYITDGTYSYKVHTIPISDANPKLGRHFECKTKEVNTNKELIHVFQTWYLPQVDIIGWLSNDGLPPIVRHSHLQPMFNCKPLCARDSRKKYT